MMDTHRENKKEPLFTEADIKSFVKTQHDFIDGKTTARDWNDIEKDLDRAFPNSINQ